MPFRRWRLFCSRYGIAAFCRFGAIEGVWVRACRRFFFRFPDGESAADVYDRVTGFRETIRNDIADRFNNEESKDITLVIVTHGISLRVFLMRWYKYNVQQFGQSPPKSCYLPHAYVCCLLPKGLYG